MNPYSIKSKDVVYEKAVSQIVNKLLQRSRKLTEAKVGPIARQEVLKAINAKSLVTAKCLSELEDKIYSKLLMDLDFGSMQELVKNSNMNINPINFHESYKAKEKYTVINGEADIEASAYGSASDSISGIGMKRPAATDHRNRARVTHTRQNSASIFSATQK